MKKLFLLIMSVAVPGFPQTAPKPPAKLQVVTAAQANGIYRDRSSEIRILALGNHKLKVQLDLAYAYKSPKGRTANLGAALGEATIDGNIATFKPPDFERCEITLVFLPNKLKVMQEGSDADCGFGHNVYATGTYHKIKSGKPRFQTPP